MYKASNLSPKNSALDINDGLIFSWDVNGEPQTAFRIYVYDNNTDLLVHDSTQITSTNEYYQFVDTGTFLGEDWTLSTNGNDGNGYYEIKNINNGIILSAKEEVIQRSNDYGVTWTTVSDNSQHINRAIAYVDNIVLVTNTSYDTLSINILRSTDYGQTWNSISLTSLGYSYSDLPKKCEYTDNGIFIVSIEDEIIRSTDYGQTWVKVGKLSSGYDIESLVYIGSGITLAGLDNGHIFRSVNYGQTWTDLGQQTISSSSSITSLEKLSNSIAIASTEDIGNSILYSDDYGVTWSQKSTSSSSSYIKNISNVGNGLVFAITYADSKILKSTNYGQVWSNVTTDLPTFDIGCCIETSGTNLLVGYTDSLFNVNYTYYSTSTPSISNGNDYKWYVKTYSVTDNQDSYYEFFQTKTKPSVEFTTPIFSSTPLVLDTQDYTFSCLYGQLENSQIKKFKMILYDNDTTTEIINTDWIYDFNITYEIEGMNTEQYYYIETIVESQDGIQNTTGKNQFYVSYSPPDILNDLVITENNINGNITIEWGNLLRILGVQSGSISYISSFFDNGLKIASGNVVFDVDYNLEYHTIHTLFKLDTGSSFNGAILNLDEDIEFGYDLTLNKFYWDDGSKTYSNTYITSTSWLMLSICSGGNTTYPIQILIQELSSGNLVNVAYIPVTTNKLF